VDVKGQYADIDVLYMEVEEHWEVVISAAVCYINIERNCHTMENDTLFAKVRCPKVQVIGVAG
jgi:hypothetical protein